MATLTDNGAVLSDDGEWQWNPDGGIGLHGGSWERIKPLTKKPGFLTRLLVKKSAWGKPGLAERRQAGKLQPSAVTRSLNQAARNLRQ